MRREDSGMFQCEGTNPAGHVTGYTWLRVKSKNIDTYRVVQKKVYDVI